MRIWYCLVLVLATRISAAWAGEFIVDQWNTGSFAASATNKLPKNAKVRIIVTTAHRGGKELIAPAKLTVNGTEIAVLKTGDRFTASTDAEGKLTIIGFGKSGSNFDKTVSFNEVNSTGESTLFVALRITVED